MKRLLCIFNNMDVGGAETFIMKLYREIDKNKYQFDFCVCSSSIGFYEKEIINMGGKIYHITPKSKSLSKFRKQLFNIVHNNYFYVLRVADNGMALMDLKICKKAGAKILACRSSNSNTFGFKNKILNFVGKILYGKYVNVRIAPSDTAATYLFGKKKNNNILLNGVNYKNFSFSQEGRNRIRKKLNYNEDNIVIGHIGRFEKQKNHKFLIKIFNKILKTEKNYRLLLIGNGSLKQDIIKKINKLGIKEYVNIVENTTDVRSYLSSMDVFVFPSFFEGMPNVIVEAQTNGLNCVISKSITKMVDISCNIKRLSIYGSINKWVFLIKNCLKNHFDFTNSNLTSQNFDIKDCLNKFIKIIFETDIN